MKNFQLELENELKYIFFFKGHNKNVKIDEDLDEFDFINRSLGFLKKNYIFVTKNRDITIKNLGLNKKSNSALSKKIFWEYLVPQIKEGKIKFSKKYIEDLIIELLNKDLSLAQMRKEVGTINDYEKSLSSLPAQISQKYGPGIHFLIPNLKNIGVGKGKKYCTIEEFKKYNMTVKDIDLSNVWQELEYFIKPVVTKNIFEF
jgi:hypothetical protein